MATATDRDRLRRDTGQSITALTDPQADLLFVEAAETYSDTASMTAYTRVLALRGLLSSYALQISYTQNEESENLSDAFKNLEKLLNYWEGKLADAIEAAAETVTGIQPQPSGTVRLRAVW